MRGDAIFMYKSIQLKDWAEPKIRNKYCKRVYLSIRDVNVEYMRKVDADVVELERGAKRMAK